MIFGILNIADDKISKMNKPLYQQYKSLSLIQENKKISLHAFIQFSIISSSIVPSN